jgi:uncharacterized membrane protein YcaP (DUF421 family)
MEHLLFNNIESLLRILILGVLAYAGLIVILRVSRKRTLSKMNAFDFVVTIALGSTLATILLNKNVTLADGLVAFALLIFLQFIITWLSVRFSKFQSFVKSEPTLLFYQGEFLWKAMKVERFTKEEIIASMRQSGQNYLEEVEAIVLESDGSLSVIPAKGQGQHPVIEGVKRI